MLGTNLCRKDKFALESLHIRMFLGNCFDHKSYELVPLPRAARQGRHHQRPGLLPGERESLMNL